MQPNEGFALRFNGERFASGINPTMANSSPPDSLPSPGRVSSRERVRSTISSRRSTHLALDSLIRLWSKHPGEPLPHLKSLDTSYDKTRPADTAPTLLA